MTSFAPFQTAFRPAHRDESEEAEHYDDYIARGEEQALKKEKVRQEAKSAKLNRPVRTFDPQPFLHDGRVVVRECVTNGMLNLVNPANPKRRFASVIIEVYGECRTLELKEKTRKKKEKMWAVPKAQGEVKEMDLAYGVYFGPDSRLNRGGIITDIPQRDKEGAYLYAAIIALKKMTKFLDPRVIPKIYSYTERPTFEDAMHLCRNLRLAREETKLIVIKSDSKLLRSCLNTNIYKWLERGFHNAKGLDRPAAPMMREIHNLMLPFEEKGVAVQFWGGEQYETSDVKDIARKALDDHAELRADFTNTK